MRVEEEDSHLPNPIKDQATKKLSSVLEHQSPLSGLSREEERKYLPTILGISPDHREFGQKVQTYWAEKSHRIPSEGMRLETGTDPEGEPINLEDWIIYKWAKKHPLVADSKEDAKADPTVDFFIYDPQRESRKQSQQVQLRTQAYTELAKMKEDEDKMDLMIRVMGNSRPDEMSSEQKMNTLDSLLSSDPERFIKTAQDENLEIQAEILEMIDQEILRKVGNKIMYMDEQIGDTMEEAVLWFKDKKNSSDVNTLRAKLQEAQR
jgi:hypothetical protein